MIDPIHIQELKRLRLEPLSQLALLKLKEADIADNEAVLPVFRLMEWGLATGAPHAHRRTARELLRLRHQSNQRAALNYLLEDLAGGLPELHRKLLRMSPQGAARTLLDILDMRRKADMRIPYLCCY